MSRRLKAICENPDGDRAAETTNHIAEHLFDLVTREAAIEAAVYWRNETDQLSRKLNTLRTDMMLKGAEIVEVCRP